MAEDEKKKSESFCSCWFREGRVFTLEEEHILGEIRKLKAQYDTLKKHLKSLTHELPDSPKIDEIQAEILNLKEKRKHLETLRQKAAKERMKLLGHSS